MVDARSFGRYRVTGTLGTGAMGEVFAAVDDVLGREVAVKTLRGHGSALAARILDERFRLEARAIARLHHPGVVQLFDLDLTAEPPYLVMERVAGPSLKDRLAAGTLPLDELRTLGIQIARALAAAHAAGVVHRDVKPANILAAGAGIWKLADFGVAHVPDSSLTLTGQFVGSPAYAPPEALVRGQSGPAGDIYGLGATLYEAAAGRWPRRDALTGALLAPLPPLADLVPGMPAGVGAAIDRAVALEPEQRPSAGELADALAGAPVGAMDAGMAASAGAPAGAADASAAGLAGASAGAAEDGAAMIAGAAHAGAVIAGAPVRAADVRAAVIAGATTGAPRTGVAGNARAADAGAAVIASAADVGATGIAHASAGADAGTPAGAATSGVAVIAGAPAAPGLAARADASDAGAVAVVVASQAGIAPVALPTPPRGLRRWMPWALGGAMAVLIAVLASRGSSTAVIPLAAPPGALADPRPPEAEDIVIAPPAGMNGKQTHDWNKIVDELERGHYDGARHKLREFEDRYGQTDETRALGPQLDALGPDVPRGPDRPHREGHGRGKNHRGD